MNVLQYIDAKKQKKLREGINFYGFLTIVVVFYQIHSKPMFL